MISTKLIIPDTSSGEDQEQPTSPDENEPEPPQDESNPPPLSTSLLTQHNRGSKPSPSLEWVVVRIEVSDTGCGIRPEDMVQSKLFCEPFSYVLYPSPNPATAAFNQTEQGRTQGLFSIMYALQVSYAFSQGGKVLV
jgi:osomolarity two-component system sensor histidine kinase SLN1